jgi:phage/plasmid-associated DNA primase
MVKAYDNAIPNDLARLKGARMVSAIEANFGRQIDEAKVKAIIGDDKLTARFMRGEWFEFVPEFKRWMVANDFSGFGNPPTHSGVGSESFPWTSRFQAASATRALRRN